MRVLVTGAAGFIGSHLVPELTESGLDVAGIDRSEGDLRVPGVFAGLLSEHEPDLVVHLAAKVGRLFGEEDALATMHDNAGMTMRVALACGKAGIPLVYTSTSEVYGDRRALTVAENDVIHEVLPHNAYGLTKRWGEEACRLYAPKNLTILRLSMPYGPGHPPGTGRAALTNFLHSALSRQPLTVHRDSERAWCWVGDTVRGIRLVIESGLGGAWNIGRDDNALSMRTVAEMACDLVGAPYSLIQEVDPPGMQTVVKRLSTKKLCGLGWRPEVELEEGMRRTLDWLLELKRAA